MAKQVFMLNMNWEDYIGDGCKVNSRNNCNDDDDNDGDDTNDDDDDENDDDDDRWESAGGVLEKLEATYKEENGTAAWWEGVVERHYGCGGPPYFSGWLVQDFLGEQPDEAPLGLVTVPLTIEDKGVKEQVRITRPPPPNLLVAGGRGGRRGWLPCQGRTGGWKE